MTNNTQITINSLEDWCIALNEISKIAYLEPLDALKMLDDMRKQGVYYKDYYYLENAVMQLAVYNLTRLFDREKDCCAWFYENLTTLIPNAIMSNYKCDLKHRPDFFLEIDGELVPVEVKNGKFGSAALRQLERYINHYSCGSGVAVGRSLDCELPNNIKFIQISKASKINGGKND